MLQLALTIIKGALRALIIDKQKIVSNNPAHLICRLVSKYVTNTPDATSFVKPDGFSLDAVQKAFAMLDKIILDDKG